MVLPPANHNPNRDVLSEPNGTRFVIPDVSATRDEPVEGVEDALQLVRKWNLMAEGRIHSHN
jgi:hypothetical protein